MENGASIALYIARMRESIVQTKSYAFALLIIQVSRSLHEAHEYVLSRQLLRAGTSVGANVEEANQAESRADFIHKISIALKEACETNYWLRLLRDSSYIEQSQAAPLLEACTELQKILTAILKTSRSKT